MSMSVTKERLQAGGHWLWFGQEKDELCQIYLPKTCYARMNITPAFNPDLMRELLSCTVTRWSQLIIGLLLMMMMSSPSKSDKNTPYHGITVNKLISHCNEFYLHWCEFWAKEWLSAIVEYLSHYQVTKPTKTNEILNDLFYHCPYHLLAHYTNSYWLLTNSYWLNVSVLLISGYINTVQSRAWN